MKVPFKPKDGRRETLSYMILNQQPVDPLADCFSKDIRQIVQALLVFNPEKRWKVSDILNDPLIADRKSDLEKKISNQFEELFPSFFDVQKEIKRIEFNELMNTEASRYFRKKRELKKNGTNLYTIDEEDDWEKRNIIFVNFD